MVSDVVAVVLTNVIFEIPVLAGPDWVERKQDDIPQAPWFELLPLSDGRP